MEIVTEVAGKKYRRHGCCIDHEVLSMSLG